MWLEHISETMQKYQSKTPENYIDFLDLNLDLPFAKFMMELLSPKIKFITVGDYIKMHVPSSGRNWTTPGHPDHVEKINSLDHAAVNRITFKGVDDNEIGGNFLSPPSVVKFRFYLQKTLLDEINTEYFSAELSWIEKNNELLPLLNTIINNIDTHKKIKKLLYSIGDIIRHDLFSNPSLTV